MKNKKTSIKKLKNKKKKKIKHLETNEDIKGDLKE